MLTSDKIKKYKVFKIRNHKNLYGLALNIERDFESMADSSDGRAGDCRSKGIQLKPH